MFGFGKKKEDPNRAAARGEFEQMVTLLKTADDLVQAAVGHSINLANSMFRQSFPDISDFQRIPKSDRIEYMHRLAEVEERLKNEKNDYPASVGFGLFKMWVGAVAENDSELIESFTKELDFFSQKGDIS